MRCIVTGGAGFIGGHLARKLHSNDHVVLVLDNAWTSDFDLPGIAADICNRDQIIGIFKDFRPDIVFHLAGVADARAVLAEPVKAVHINVVGAAIVLEAALQGGTARVVLASSSWVYNSMAVGHIDESEPFLPCGGGHIYTSSMITRELLAHDFHQLYGLSFSVLRYSPVYGPGMWPGLALSNFIQAAKAGGPLVVFGDGQEARTFLYVDDLVDAFVRALREVARNQVYNIEGPRAVTVNELAARVSAMFGGVEVVRREEPSRRGELRYSGRTISCDKARHELGWAPLVDIEEGILRILKASDRSDEYRPATQNG